MKTLEKLNELVTELQSTNLAETSGRQRDLVELLQIAEGIGFDPLALLLPSSDAEADMMVDSLIALLLHVRGDDLPRFDLERHVSEATATDRDAA